ERVHVYRLAPGLRDAPGAVDCAELLAAASAERPVSSAAKNLSVRKSARCSAGFRSVHSSFPEAPSSVVRIAAIFESMSSRKCSAIASRVCGKEGEPNSYV